MKLKMISIVLLLPILINLLVFNSTDIVSEAQTIRVTNVELHTDELVFDRLGTTQPLIAIVMPAQATNRRVTFSTSNDQIATVDEIGNVTAVSNGLAHITVTTEDGNHTASAAIRVESFFIEEFQVTIEGGEGNSAGLFEEDSTHVIVSISPIEAMMQSVPFITVTNPNILAVSPFEIISYEGNTTTFKTRITGIRSGTVGVRIFINERHTGDILEQHLEITVSSRADDRMRLLFDGMRFDENAPLVAASSEIPLQVSMPVPGQEPFFYIVTDEEQEYDEVTIAYIFTENDGSQILRFTEAGTINLNFGAGTYTSTVEITSTFHRLDETNVRRELSDFMNISLHYRQPFQIMFDISPFDFLNFYDVTWETSIGITLMFASETNVFITANQVLNNQYVRVIFTHNEDPEDTFYVKFNIEILNFGVDEIFFELNNDAVFIRGLEQTYVFGNMNAGGGDFQFTMRFAVQQSPNASNRFNFTSDNEDLATVNNNGMVTFNSQFDFGPNNRAYVTITATSAYPTLNNPNFFATDSYTFIVVRGANVSNFLQYQTANNANLDIVLRNNIQFSVTMATSGSLHGNGYTMDASAVANTINDPMTNIFTFFNAANLTEGNETLITNVVFSGFADTGIVNLSNRGTLVSINGNTTLQYSILERAAILLYISTDAPIGGGEIKANENIHVYSNLLSYAGFAGVYLGSNRGLGLTAQNIVFEDLIFESTLIGIVFEPSEVGTPRSTFELTLRGRIHFYNWLRVNDLRNLSITFEGHEIELSSFDFNVLETTVVDGVAYTQLSIVIIDVTDNNGNTFRWTTTAVFDSQTADRLGQITSRIGDNPNVTPLSGTDYNIVVSRGANIDFSWMGGPNVGRPVLSIHNPREGASDFVGVLEQRQHFLNPDRSLITRQIV